GMIAKTSKANHHLCFDRDRAGKLFAINFALTKAGKTFNTHLTPKGKLIVVDTTDKYHRHELNPDLFEFDRLVKILGADTRTQGNEMAEYMESLRNEEDIFSGDEYLLPPDLLKAYRKYESACEEYHSAKYSGLVCQEDLEDIGDELKTSCEAYKAAMKNAASPCESAGRIIYQPCDKEYKDWNDQLLCKRITVEEENNEEEERTYHFRR
ncbi:hypothetical protein LJC05_04685, partial [Bacteroides sp. OttesenSCG-928-J23]|nr:hypothetical protein [Bacteroides sp. OttesenSCG-928-J23]